MQEAARLASEIALSELTNWVLWGDENEESYIDLFELELNLEPKSLAHIIDQLNKFHEEVCEIGAHPTVPVEAISKPIVEELTRRQNCVIETQDLNEEVNAEADLLVIKQFFEKLKHEKVENDVAPMLYATMRSIKMLETELLFD